jgi:hypothetical protein
MFILFSDITIRTKRRKMIKARRAQVKLNAEISPFLTFKELL